LFNEQLNIFSFYHGGSLGQVQLNLDVLAALWVSDVYRLQSVMILFSSPAYATMLSIEASFWDGKPRAFYSALASAPSSDYLFALCWNYY
jgi:hypothetical protein